MRVDQHTTLVTIQSGLHILGESVSGKTKTLVVANLRLLQ